MRHFKDPRFRPLYDALPADVRGLADKQFQLLKRDPKHPSLHFKRIRGISGRLVSVAARALAIEVDGDYQWFWIGSHADYDDLVR